MFREMRRKTQQLSYEESISVLRRGTSGVLATEGDNGYPYAVPMSYVYCDGKIWFHCAKTGHKIDAITKNEKVSFCVIEKDDVRPREFTTYYRSVIVFGKVRVLEKISEKRAALEKLAEKYSPDDEAGRLKEIEKSFEHLHMIELVIEHITGKEARKFVQSKVN